MFLNAGILGKIDKIEKINNKSLDTIFKINVFANKEIIDFLIKIKSRQSLSLLFLRAQPLNRSMDGIYTAAQKLHLSS